MNDKRPQNKEQIYKIKNSISTVSKWNKFMKFEKFIYIN